MRSGNVKFQFLACLLFGLLPGSISMAQTVDSKTQRHKMHSCPLGQFIVGIHVGKNLLLCSGGFGNYTAAQENFNRGSYAPYTFMEACIEGMAATGLHAGKKLVKCAPVAGPPLQRFVDPGTQRFNMHACPPGNVVVGIDVNRNLLLCGTRSTEPMPMVDVVTQRNGMHSCLPGLHVIGVHVGRNLLLCADFGGYFLYDEVVQRGSAKSPETQSHGMHACPLGKGVTGLHAGKNLLTCAPVRYRRDQRRVDASTQRFAMHACPRDMVLSGFHRSKNLLLCGTDRLDILSFTAEPNGGNIRRGESALLRWNIDCTAPGCRFSLTGGELNLFTLPLTGSRSVTPDNDTKYTLTARIDAGGVREVRDVWVRVAP